MKIDKHEKERYYTLIRQQIEEWIQNKVRESKARGVVIGLSGGIDSSVAATLCVNALSTNNVIGLVLPAITTAVKDNDDGLAFGIEFLNIQTDVVVLEEPCEYMVSIINPSYNNRKIALANIQARMRMLALYVYANQYNFLVCGTTNKTEAMIGYYTKYGDGGVDIEPIADLYKTEVRGLATHLGIPKHLITKAPSAGLWEGQTDEDELGISYDLLDKILWWFNKYKQENLPSDIYNKFQKSEIEKVKNFIRNSEHKRHMPPYCNLEK